MTQTSFQSISKKELKKKMDQNEDFQIVNVLPPEHHNLGLIKGSLKIPVSELEKRQEELDKSKEVVVYCASHECNASRDAAKKLAQLGFNVRAYEGGIKEWKESGFPTE